MNEAWKVATIRAVAGALVLGSISAVAMWSATNDLGLIVRAGLTPALLYLAARLGIEGYVDSKK